MSLKDWTYVYRHLDARLCACAFEDDVDAVLHIKVRKRSADVLLRALEGISENKPILLLGFLVSDSVGCLRYTFSSSE